MGGFRRPECRIRESDLRLKFVGRILVSDIFLRRFWGSRIQKSNLRQKAV
ncbi:hypothetical protein HMPREF9120_00182 [Neisseria sp. oral taxon 020 str. F0370]|nr:hypothetical protein HMPREF9120_00182 [Neisseria sp. oral taxon 020 str. F0370]